MHIIFSWTGKYKLYSSVIKHNNVRRLREDLMRMNNIVSSTVMDNIVYYYIHVKMYRLVIRLIADLSQINRFPLKYA